MSIYGKIDIQKVQLNSDINFAEKLWEGMGTIRDRAEKAFADALRARKFEFLQEGGLAGEGWKQLRVNLEGIEKCSFKLAEKWKSDLDRVKIDSDGYVKECRIILDEMASSHRRRHVLYEEYAKRKERYISAFQKWDEADALFEHSKESGKANPERMLKLKKQAEERLAVKISTEQSYAEIVRECFQDYERRMTDLLTKFERIEMLRLTSYKDTLKKIYDEWETKINETHEQIKTSLNEIDKIDGEQDLISLANRYRTNIDHVEPPALILMQRKDFTSASPSRSLPTTPSQQPSQQSPSQTQPSQLSLQQQYKQSSQSHLPQYARQQGQQYYESSSPSGHKLSSVPHPETFPQSQIQSIKQLKNNNSVGNEREQNKTKGPTPPPSRLYASNQNLINNQQLNGQIGEQQQLKKDNPSNNLSTGRCYVALYDFSPDPVRGEEENEMDIIKGEVVEWLSDTDDKSGWAHVRRIEERKGIRDVGYVPQSYLKFSGQVALRTYTAEDEQRNQKSDIYSQNKKFILSSSSTSLDTQSSGSVDGQSNEILPYDNPQTVQLLISAARSTSLSDSPVLVSSSSPSNQQITQINIKQFEEQQQIEKNEQKKVINEDKIEQKQVIEDYHKPESNLFPSTQHAPLSSPYHQSQINQSSQQSNTSSTSSYDQYSQQIDSSFQTPSDYPYQTSKPFHDPYALPSSGTSAATALAEQIANSASFYDDYQTPNQTTNYSSLQEHNDQFQFNDADDQNQIHRGDENWNQNMTSEQIAAQDAANNEHFIQAQVQFNYDDQESQTSLSVHVGEYVDVLADVMNDTSNDDDESREGGHNLQVHICEGGWVIARRPNTQERGYLPYDYIRLVIE